MPHLHTEPGQHDLTVSMYIIRTDFERPKILLHRHKKMNIWLQFGGHVELDENPWQTVEHELVEETGYKLPQLKILQPEDRLVNPKMERLVTHPQPFYVNTHPISTSDLAGAEHYHTDLCYAFVANSEPALHPAENESNDFKLVAEHELESLKGEVWDDTITICKYVFTVCLPKWKRVSI